MSVVASFGGFVAAARDAGRLVVQPRMGVSDPGLMRTGLEATRAARATTVGTITLDSYTRLGDYAAARAAARDGAELNGYPLLAHSEATTRAVLDGVAGPAFPVQVRHGSADPRAIVARLASVGLCATEGGPVSYCLPYGRTRLRDSVANWAESCRFLAGLRGPGVEPHVETFGGCMLGQLCPPSLLVALSVLEALFLAQHGLRSVSLSYAQQANAEQDREAIAGLHRLAAEHLSQLDWHVVLYTYMGVYPRTARGALRLLGEAARLAVRTGVARLVVKTTAEAHRIPTLLENVTALEHAATVAGSTRRAALQRPPDDGLEQEARALVDAVLELDDDVGRALTLAFRRGYLDVPYCLHPDNAGRARAALDVDGRLRWTHVGSMPIASSGSNTEVERRQMGSAALLAALTYVQQHFDEDNEEMRERG